MLYVTISRPTGIRSAWRILRATIRDWWLLFSEFRWPLALFLLASEIVAILFHAYYTHPDYPHGLAIDEAFYVILTLTVLGSAVPTPAGSGHWLIIFFFLMPLVGLVLASQGLANFLALLFNRRARGPAWLDAVASTYNRHIVVCGLGHVGSRVVENLLAANSEVVGIDHQSTETRSVARVRSWHVPVIQGDIRQHDVLRRAGVARARTVVICTDNDLANLDAAMTCRELNPKVRLVLRLFDEELARRVKTLFGVDEAFSASSLAAPVFAAAALQIEGERTFAIGDDVLSVGRLAVQPGSRLHGRTIGHVEENLDCSIIAHTRAGKKDIHPPDRLELAPGDCLIILADVATLNRLTGWNRSRRL